jgi:hypothetical protein
VKYTWTRQAAARTCLRACCVFPVLSANAHSPAGFKSIGFRALRESARQLSQIKHGRDPETTARGSLQSLSPVFSLFGYTCETACLSTDRGIFARRVRHYRLSPACHPIAMQTRQTLSVQPYDVRRKESVSARARSHAIVLAKGEPYRNQLSGWRVCMMREQMPADAPARYVRSQMASPPSCRAVNQRGRGRGHRTIAGVQSARMPADSGRS